MKINDRLTDNETNCVSLRHSAVKQKTEADLRRCLQEKVFSLKLILIVIH